MHTNRSTDRFVELINCFNAFYRVLTMQGIYIYIYIGYIGAIDDSTNKSTRYQSVQVLFHDDHNFFINAESVTVSTFLK